MSQALNKKSSFVRQLEAGKLCAEFCSNVLACSTFDTMLIEQELGGQSELSPCFYYYLFNKIYRCSNVLRKKGICLYFFVFFPALAEKPLLSQFLPETPIPPQNRRTLEQNARNPHGYSVFLFYSQTLRSTMF